MQTFKDMNWKHVQEFLEHKLDFLKAREICHHLLPQAVLMVGKHRNPRLVLSIYCSNRCSGPNIKHVVVPPSDFVMTVFLIDDKF